LGMTHRRTSLGGWRGNVHAHAAINLGKPRELLIDFISNNIFASAMGGHLLDSGEEAFHYLGTYLTRPTNG
jgi:hypothetical protein